MNYAVNAQDSEEQTNQIEEVTVSGSRILQITA
jgi:hypothetical protein